MKISVIIPTINRGSFLEDSLFLYTRQTMHRYDFEVIILDDDSTDNSIEIAQKYAPDLQLRYFIFQGKRLLHPKLRYSSAGRMLNFAIRTIAKSDLILYSDPEVMPLPAFVEQHYISHQRGHVVKEPAHIAPGCPGRGENGHNYTVQDGSYLIRGLCYKLWAEHTHYFGRHEDYDWKDITTTWDRLWALTDALPKDFLGTPMAPVSNHGDFTYRSGAQDFWGFVGSQAGLSFGTQPFCKMGGYEEAIDTPGQWGGEDTELQLRQMHNGLVLMNNPNIQAVHLYHPKPGYNATKFVEIRKLADDPSHLYGNVDNPDWGTWRNHIVEINLSEGK